MKNRENTLNASGLAAVRRTARTARVWVARPESAKGVAGLPPPQHALRRLRACHPDHSIGFRILDKRKIRNARAVHFNTSMSLVSCSGLAAWPLLGGCGAPIPSACPFVASARSHFSPCLLVSLSPCLETVSLSP